MLPKVAYMDSFSGRNDSDIEDESSPSPQITISCPSCSTRFSVDSAEVSAMEHPRFHCSRCDAIFGLPQATMHEQRNTHSMHVSPTPAAEHRSRPSYNHSRSSAVTPTIKASDFSLSNHETASQQVEAGMTPANSPGKKENSTIRSTGGWELFPSDQTSPQSAEATADDIDFTAPLKSNTEALADTAQTVAAITTAPPTLPETADAIGHASLFERFFGSRTLRFQGLMFMTTPLVAVSTLLVVLSYSSRVSPETIGKAVRILAPTFLSKSVPKLPPLGLSVQGLKLSYIKTQTKEIIPVISGVVVNSGAESVDGVTLEGLAFNDRGEPILSSQAPLKSALSREKASDLSLETIRKFQLSLSARKAAIGPSEEVPFTIALLDTKRSDGAVVEDELNNLKYFSARVFSVK